MRESKFGLLVLLLFGVVLFSCNGGKEKQESVIVEKNESHADTIPKTEEEIRAEKRRLIEIENRRDSIYLVSVLDEALTRSRKHKSDKDFSESFEISSDSIFNVVVKIDYGHHFDSKMKHLIIRRYSPGSTQFDIYFKEGNKFKSVLSHEQWALTYTGDTIQDINGDGIKDFVVHWYGAAGCCLKANSDVFILKSDFKSFSDITNFLNPTFSPKERVIRGICYGHPGETEMYKFKWNGEKIDTVEYVSFELDKEGKKTGKVVISNQYPYHDNFKVIRILNKAPVEYRNIDGYDWFLGFI